MTFRRRWCIIILSNKKRRYYISGIKQFYNNNNPCTYIFIKESFNEEEKNIPIIVKVNKAYKWLSLYSCIYLNNIIGVEISKDKNGKDCLIIQVDDIEIDVSSLLYEDYACYIDDSPDIWYSPFRRKVWKI